MVYDLAIDKYGNKWFGTAEGIYKYNDSHWTNYNETDGLINNKVRSIAVDSSNTVWIGTNFGLSKFDGSAWVNFYAKTDIHPEGKLPNETIGKIVIGKNGHLYLLHDSYGFSEYDGKDFKVYNTETSKLISNAVSALAIDLKGDIWVGTPYGITLIHDSISVNYTTNDGLIDNGVSDIKIDILGNIWISTFKGISMFDGLKFVNYKCTNINIDSYVLTNISSEETEKSNNIFPNPVNSYFQIPDSKFNNGNFSIRDITGKFICQKRIQENNVDVDDLKPGLYIVTLLKGSSSCKLKIIKK
jgi:ligand-binding sensor domain-containing protein